MKKFFTTLAAVAAVLALMAMPVSAALIGPTDSSAFANQYDGDEINDGSTTFLNGWDEDASGLTQAQLSLANTDNLLISQTDTNGWVQHDNGSSPWEVGSGSWTVEVRAHVMAMTGGFGGMNIWGALNGERNIMTVREGSVGDLASGIYDTSDNTDGFHTFRLAYDAADDVYHYFRDGVQITPLAGIGQQGATGSTRLIVGDCCTNVNGSQLGGPGNSVEIDYIRYDMTGAFTPVPEPSTIALAGLGLVGLLGLRRRG